MAAGINQAVTEALAFAQAEGLPLEKVTVEVSTTMLPGLTFDNIALTTSSRSLSAETQIIITGMNNTDIIVNVSI
jgi:3-hydroxyisobutyrate dehydrogenase-like beta-hydroxyacid dehydrogenase